MDDLRLTKEQLEDLRKEIEAKEKSIYEDMQKLQEGMRKLRSDMQKSTEGMKEMEELIRSMSALDTDNVRFLLRLLLLLDISANHVQDGPTQKRETKRY